MDEDGNPLTLTQTWLQPRLLELFNGYVDSSQDDDNIRVVQGLFPWNGSTVVFVTVRLVKTDSGKFKADYSVCRYAERMLRE